MLTIRRAVAGEAAQLLRLHRDAVFAKAAGHYDRQPLEAWLPGATPERVARLEQEIADPALIVLVAETQNQALGFAIALPAENELRALYVKPNEVGGVGQRLLAAIEQRAFAAGAAYLAFDASLNAEAFYKANGYRETGRKDHVSGNGHISAAVQLQKLQPRAGS